MYMRLNKLHLVQTGKEEKNIDDKKFIEDLKELSTQEKRCLIVFNKKDVTLKINIDEVKMKMPEQEFYSKVDAKINDRIKSADIIEIFKHIPKHLSIRLEADYIEYIIKLMKSKIFIEKLRFAGIKFLYNSIEIEPRIIKSKQDEEDLIKEVKEKEAKRDRLNIDFDK